MNLGTIVFGALIALALLVFIVIKRKKKSPKLEGTAVPIHDPDEIKQLKKAMSGPSKKKLTNSQLMQMAQAEAGIAPLRPPESVIPVEKDKPAIKELPAKEPPVMEPREPAALKLPPDPTAVETPAVPESPVAPAAEPPAQEELARLETEKKQLQEALEREVSSKKELPPEAQQVVDETNELKQLIEQEKARFEELDKKFASFKQEYEHQKSLAWTKEEVLQQQIVQLKEENEKLDQLKGKMEAAEAELNGLRFYKKETEESIKQMEKELLESKQANQAGKDLEQKLQDAQAQLAKAGQEAQVLKMNYEQQISDLTDKLLVLEKREPPPAPPADEATKTMLEEMRTKNEELIRVNQQLSQELEKVRELSGQFREKEKILQYELTKARAQSVGLEKICEDFKVHIERLTKVEP